MVDTLAAELFLSMTAAIKSGIAMIPRSKEDKEHFPQDWFSDCAKALPDITLQPSGRNTYPDFWATRGELREGYEIKSLAITKGVPARKDIDFNSSIPSGVKMGHRAYLVFILYTGSGESPRPIHSLALAHADLINADHELAEKHVNHAIHGFGSYGDGFIRDRKMYVLPHPLTIYPAGLGHASLILPTDWGVTHPDLMKVDTIRRQVAPERLRGYSIDLWSATSAATTELAPRAGQTISFDVFRRV